MNKFNLGKQENAKLSRWEIKKLSRQADNIWLRFTSIFTFDTSQLQILNLATNPEKEKRIQKSSTGRLWLLLEKFVFMLSSIWKSTILDKFFADKHLKPANGHVKPNSRQCDHKTWNSSQMKLSAFNLYHKFFICNGTS